MRQRNLLLTISISFLMLACEAKKQPPNVVYILADDLGYADLGCYGQKIIKTPNIDKLASQGVLFTQHYSGSAVCAPSRSALLTGKHTGHTPIRGNIEVGEEGQVPLPDEAYTVAELFQNEGYRTGAFGKWGLGFIDTDGDPLNQGFNEFFGYNCQRLAHRYYPAHLWQNKTKYKLHGNDWSNKVTYAPDVIQEKTLKFIEDNQNNRFFAYVPLVLPHAELISPDDSIYKMYEGKFEETPHLASEPYTSDYGPEIKKHMYTSQKMPRATYAAMVTKMDAYVGQIIDKLIALDLYDNTMVIFTSDNGPHGEGGNDPEFFDSNGHYRGIKRDLYEGGIRVPMIVSYPDKVSGGRSVNHPSAFWDIMPTMADLLETDKKIDTDGISFLPVLTGKGHQKTHPYLYWELNTRGWRRAVRFNNWKAVQYGFQRDQDAKVELYNLESDPSEQNDISDKHPELVKEALAMMIQSHKPSDLFPWKSERIKN